MTPLVLATMLTISTTAAPAPPEAPRLLVMDLSAGKGVAKDTVQTFTELLTAYLSDATRIVVVSRRDIARIADLEADKQQQGCENSDACMAEIAGALGARYVVFGRMSKLGGLTFVHVALVDSKSGQPLARKVVNAESLDSLAVQLKDACREMAQAASSSLSSPSSSPSVRKLDAGAPPASTAASTSAGNDDGTTRVVKRDAAAAPTGEAHVVEEEHGETKVPEETTAQISARGDLADAARTRAAALHEQAQQKAMVGTGVIAGGGIVGVLLVAAGFAVAANAVSAQQSASAATFITGGAGSCCILNVVTVAIGVSQMTDAADLDVQAQKLDATAMKY